jgi:hypothetical protein
MGEKIVVGPINKGLNTDRTPFVIDNDSFPYLLNAYQWRGRIKRKRGTSILGRLSRYIATTDGSGDATVTISPAPIEIGLSQFTVGTDIFVDPGTVPNPVTLLTNSAGTGVLNRTTGVLTITGSQANTAIEYFPGLPVMGLEDLNLTALQYPGTLGFDTTYSYNLSTTAPYSIYDVSFYKNPPASASLPGYVQKTTWTPTSWNGEDYQQFWTANYQNAFWATNGINVPFVVTNIGMQYRFISAIAIVSAGPPAIITITLTVASPELVVGDFLFFNEIVGTIAPSLNFQTGYIIAVTNPTTFNVELPRAVLSGTYTSGGIAQYLTNRSDPTKDCLRWYDGDPTGGTPPFPSTGLGWVNFAPPLISGPTSTFSIDDQTPNQYYLVGARIVVPFKDRLLFFGPVIQTSAANSQIYLQDTVIYSQNGTPFYTASFAGPPSATTIYQPILTPPNQNASPSAYWEDQTGFGGYISAGYAQPIITVGRNEDVLIIGFTDRFARFIYTGNDLSPFLFYIINSELGAGSTFSSVILDRGVISIGNYGIALTSQVAAQRVDLDIPDQVFEFNYTDNGAERVCSQKDYINEWIYFTYLSNEVTYNYPNQTLQFNYRDNSWAVFNESFTTYGLFRQVTGNTWATIGDTFGTWSGWNEPWDSGSSTLFMPKVIGGNQQGFVLFRDSGTSEANSLFIQNIVGNVVTAPNHCLNNGDYIIINEALGTVASQVNGNIFSVSLATTNTFVLNPSIPGGTYEGGGLIQRMYVPYIQTKQFPVEWGMARKTRLGPQQYLLTATNNGQITLDIFLSQNDAGPYNFGPIVPAPGSINNTLVYSAILYTCPESSNLGLTPANTNLQMLTASQQNQIWHRMNTSLLGDTVQIGFTLSDAQMRDITLSNQFSEIEIHGFILDVSPSMVLA